MATLSPVAFNVFLHPEYIACQEQVYGIKGQEGYGALPLKGRVVLEGQVIALRSDVPADGIPRTAFPDAAGMTANPTFHASWMGEVRWVVNQRKAFLDRDNTPLDVTIIPAVCQSLLHTGSETIHVGDQVYVHFPTDRDVETQRSAMREYFGGGWSSDHQQCPPMFATYGVRPGSIHEQVSEFRCMDRYRRYLTTDEMDLDVSIDAQEGTIPQIELSKVTRIARLLSYVLAYLKREDIQNDILALGTGVDTDTAGNEKSLQVCRESNVFKTSVGVEFTSTLLAMLNESDSAKYLPKPIGEVLQSMEPSRDQCIYPGQKMVVKLYAR